MARVRSTQKLPMVFIDCRAKPRTSAMATARPAAAESEVVHRQPGHLHEVAQRGLGHVALPVGVGGEADGGVEAEVGADIARAEALRIERQPDLQPLDGVEQHGAEGAEGQQRAGVAGPVLLFGCLCRPVDAADPVDQALDGPRTGVRKFRRPSMTVAMKEPSGFAQARISRKKIAICNQPLVVMTFSRNSELLRPQQRVEQIYAERERNQSRNQVFHISLSTCSQAEACAICSRSQARTIIQATAKKATINRQ